MNLTFTQLCDYFDKHESESYLFHKTESFDIDRFTQCMSTEALHCFKPRGLWFSIGSAFFKWEYKERYFTSETNYIYKLMNKYDITTDITDVQKKKVLEIRQSDVLDFHNKYHIGNIFKSADLCRDFGGLIFTNYDPYRTFYECVWYNCIDADSGCIWNPELVKDVVLIAKKNVNGLYDIVM
jgi:hypothetical protein